MGDGTGVVSAEGAHDLEGLRKDADDAIGATQEYTFGPGDDGGNVTGL